MTDLSSLVERVERLDGPDREMDAEIHLEVYTTITLPDAPAYTASLDAAMQLVPEGCAWSVGWDITLRGVATVYGQDIAVDTDAATPALALTSAALKARARVREGE